MKIYYSNSIKQLNQSSVSAITIGGNAGVPNKASANHPAFFLNLKQGYASFMPVNSVSEYYLDMKSAKGH